MRPALITKYFPRVKVLAWFTIFVCFLLILTETLICMPMFRLSTCSDTRACNLATFVLNMKYYNVFFKTEYYVKVIDLFLLLHSH